MMYDEEWLMVDADNSIYFGGQRARHGLVKFKEKHGDKLK